MKKLIKIKNEDESIKGVDEIIMSNIKNEDESIKGVDEIIMFNTENEDEILKLCEELSMREKKFLEQLQIALNNTVEIIKLSDNLVSKEDRISEVSENVIIEQDIMKPVKDAMKKMGSDLSNKDLISSCYLEVKESINNRTDIREKYAYCYKVATNYLKDNLLKDIKSQL